MSELFEPALCAYVDVLGFRQKIEDAYSTHTEETLFQSLSETFRVCGSRIKEAAAHLPMLKLKLFSDNLVLAYSILPFFGPSLSHLCELLANYQLNMACDYGLFLRGGISIGTLGVNENIIFGDCLLKAHDLEESAAKFPRIMVDTEIEKRVAANPSQLETSWLLRDSDALLFVNYLKALFQPNSVGWKTLTLCINEDQLSSHRKRVEVLLDEARKVPDVWFKYFWVANYHNHFCDTQGQQRFKIPEHLMLSKPTEVTIT